MLDRDMPLKKEIANNIKKQLQQKRITQKELAATSGIPTSTISDYMNMRTLANPGNIEKIASALGVEKSDIDPTFKKEEMNSHIETIAAHIDDDTSEEELQEILDFIEFKKSTRK